MFYLTNLIRNEYFPSELPPCFNTDLLAKNSNDVLGWANSSNKKSSIPYTFSGFKNINSRRKFAIANPYHYLKAIEVIRNNSDEIFKILDKSEISLSKPLRGKPLDDKAYKKISNSISDTRHEIEMLYQDNEYQIKLDISAFFDSIYTHSIPWAIHGKSTAKKDRSKSLAGNAIDNCMQAMNYSQTNGILVGNAVSRIISEIILCTVDKKIQDKFDNIRCKRFVDDYYIFTKDSYQIQSIISFIRNELGKYELTLNENKINILESPFIYGKQWIEELKLYIHLDKTVFLNKVISLYLDYKDISIFRYGITVVSMHEFSKNDWILIESKIINIWTKFPSLSDLIIKLFISNKSSVKKSNIKKAINSILDKNIPLNHHQEIIWAVWVAKVFKIGINSKYMVEIIESENDVAIIILLDMINIGICKKSKELSKAVYGLKVRLDEYEDVMFSSNWLLAYEINFNDWFDGYDQEFNKAKENDFFNRMIKKGINFYNTKFEYIEDEKKSKNMGYVTKKEFYKHLQRIDDLIVKLNCNNEKKDSEKYKHLSDIISKESKEIIEEISKISDTY